MTAQPAWTDTPRPSQERLAVLEQFRLLHARLSEPSDNAATDLAAAHVLSRLVDQYGPLPAASLGWSGLGDPTRDNDQVLAPVFSVEALSETAASGTVRFTRAYSGRDAAHGGAIALFFDEVLGRLLNNAEPPSRTAYLHVDYRRLTPLEETITFVARIDRVEGRKRFLAGSLVLHGELLAEADGLWVVGRGAPGT
ncbi:MAG: hypothetical protein JWM84_3889 [Nocardioides sp.]|nr:hypothetical protein [Nocardioides sp.]